MDFLVRHDAYNPNVWGPSHRGISLKNSQPKEESMAKQKLKKLLINRDWCKSCGICVAYCPKQVLELDKEDKAVAARPEDCIVCKMCELRCPDLAIEVITEEGEKEDNEK